MKRYLLYIAIIALALVGCRKDESAGYGKLSFDGFTATVTNSTRAVSTDDFTVTLNSASGVIGSWRYAELPANIELRAGTYSVSVVSASEFADTSRTAYYAGSADIEVVSGATTAAPAIVCTPQSIKISVGYSAELTAAMAADCKTSVSLGTVKFTFDNTDTAPVYFRPAADENTLVVSFAGTVDGFPEKMEAQITGVKAGQWRKITIKMTYIDGVRTFGAVIDNWTYDGEWNVNQ